MWINLRDLRQGAVNDCLVVRGQTLCPLWSIAATTAMLGAQMLDLGII